MDRKSLFSDILCDCLGNIKNSSELSDHYLILLKEIEHLNLLINVFKSQLIISRYYKFLKIISCEINKINKKNILNIEPLFNYKNYIDTLKQYKYGLLNCSEDIDLFVNVLEVCRDNLTYYIKNNKLIHIADEIYLNHNIPLIIRTLNIDLIEYYLNIEVKSDNLSIPNSNYNLYLPIWNKILSEFNS